ncbi:hypothetical protein SELMODRAFT_83698 [Selaginella moellendorffii]|uniref:Pentacotripeptide-repeat region of PRORP domain-containing protein n=1 Tax=Selaginella moellendorffii TaxID=88036 RepID=D8R2S5_SELML|nr:hypothetical protein SELMODRAFT_83698 [Selaginella moellendorffii]
MLRKCSALSQVKWVHRIVAEDGWEDDTFVANFLIQMYGRCGGAQEAAKVFEKLPRRNQFSWNIMLAAFAQNGHLQEAREIFDRSPHRNVVTWNAMMAAYAMAGRIREAEIVFKKMPQRDLISPNDSTLVSILDSAASSSDLNHARFVQGVVEECDEALSVDVKNAIIGMYKRCGSIENARRVFVRIENKDTVSWNSIIAAYADLGDCKEAIELFELMSLEGFEPSRATYLSVLGACSHAGLVKEGVEVFASMVEFGVVPTREHFSCMVDLFGRGGWVAEAHEVFSKGPLRPSVTAWRALCGAFVQQH